jgi:hypothetical protein
MIAAGQRLVLANGHQISILDLGTRRVTPLLHVSGEISGVDAAAGRVVWAESLGEKRFRIRSIALPR